MHFLQFYPVCIIPAIGRNIAVPPIFLEQLNCVVCFCNGILCTRSHCFLHYFSPWVHSQSINWTIITWEACCYCTQSLILELLNAPFTVVNILIIFKSRKIILNDTSVVIRAAKYGHFQKNAYCCPRQKYLGHEC